jgi:hypothetical protein
MDLVNHTDIFSSWQFALPLAIVLWTIFILRITKPSRDAKRRARRVAATIRHSNGYITTK